MLSSAAAGAVAKRKNARMEDVSKLTIKSGMPHTELDITVSPPTPGMCACVCVFHLAFRVNNDATIGQSLVLEKEIDL